ncbi:MAG: hypothetical protein NVS2B12_14660 [Ktedonobacteraceae bacterium]
MKNVPGLEGIQGERPDKKARDRMLTYILTFGIVIVLLVSAVLVHMSFGLNRLSRKASLGELARTPHLDDVLFHN